MTRENNKQGENKINGVLIYTSEEYLSLNQTQNLEPNKDIVIGVYSYLIEIKEAIKAFSPE